MEKVRNIIDEASGRLRAKERASHLEYRVLKGAGSAISVECAPVSLQRYRDRRLAGCRS